MPCSSCPQTVQRPVGAASKAAVIRVTVNNYTEEQAIIAKYPGYAVRRQVLGSNTTVLILTKT